MSDGDQRPDDDERERYTKHRRDRMSAEARDEEQEQNYSDEEDTHIATSSICQKDTMSVFVS